MGWTTRNHEKSGSTPSLKLAVEIQSSVLVPLQRELPADVKITWERGRVGRGSPGNIIKLGR